jgi:hypothetical protein
MQAATINTTPNSVPIAGNVSVDETAIQQRVMTEVGKQLTMLKKQLQRVVRRSITVTSQGDLSFRCRVDSLALRFLHCTCDDVPFG